MNLELVNLNELFNYVLDRFDMIITSNEKKSDEEEPEKNYSIKRNFTKRDLWVEIDTDRFTQVLDNIMNNAIKYSPDGGVITCLLVDTHNNVIISISDQGLGIPRADQTHIFDRFYRVDKARARAQGGTGLGLAISREVVQMLGGRIWVDSHEGRGSTFYITLPYEPYEGTFGMKVTRKIFLPVALLVAVVLSMILSWFIWTNNPVRYERNKEDTVTSTSTQRDLSTKSIRDIYLPVQVITTDVGGNQNLVNNHKVNLVTEIRDRMSTWKSNRMVLVKSRSKSDYLAQLRRPDTVMMNYDSSITVKVFNRVFKNQLKGVRNRKFNRIQIKMDDAKHIYLLNDNGYRIYRVTVSGQKLSKLRSVLKTNLIKYPINLKMVSDQPTVFINKGLKMPRYSYMINKQDANNFVNRLMSSDNDNISIKKRQM